MRILFLLFILCSGLISQAQPGSFPQSWTGNWKGELQWYKGTSVTPQTVQMELRIHPLDTAGQYSWQIIYGEAGKDNRPYRLLAKDTAKGHWVIDENNGILIDQFWVGGKFCGAFTVQSSTIVNNYTWKEGKIIVEFFGISAKPISTTGKGTEDSPTVDSYRVATYQYAVLTRQ